MIVNWEKLAQIKELKEYFETDFAGFQQLIESHIESLSLINGEELDKLAMLRAIEVTNGCLQWAFRRQDKECLSVEQTRECMRLVIGFMDSKTIKRPNGETINFSPELEQLMDKVRSLYQDAFKKNIESAEREFHAYSTAQFLACGCQRLELAQSLVAQDFESLFTPYYLQKGRNYIAPYIDALST